MKKNIGKVIGFVQIVGMFMILISTVEDYISNNKKKGFICPQCSAPRRRYAKKVGDEWGVTNDGGDLPIYAFTFAGLALTTWFALVYVPTL